MIADYLFTTEAYNTTARNAADEFARKYWDVPREVDDFVHIPNLTCDFYEFTVVDGTCWYRVTYHMEDKVQYFPAVWAVQRVKSIQ